MSRFWLKWSGVFLGLSLVFGLASIASAKRDLQKAGNADPSLRAELGDWALRVAESSGDGRFRFSFSNDDSASNGVSGAWIPVPCEGSEDMVFASQGLKELEVAAISARIRIAESTDDQIHVRVIRTSKQCGEDAKKPRLHATLNAGAKLEVSLKENDDYAYGEKRELVVLVPKSESGYSLEVSSVSSEFSIQNVKPKTLKTHTVSGDADVGVAAFPEKWEHESVSGDLNVKSAEKPQAQIEMESVSGDLKLAKNWGYSVTSNGGPGTQALVASPSGKVSGQWEFNTVSGDITLE
jgi:hypothetical protein